MNDSSKRGAQRPYQALGTHLKIMREQHNESLAEVSGAVEIDQDALERIESGHDRPTEDILMLLINHFDVQDQEAVQLWQSAGYEGSSDDNPIRRQLEGIEKATVVVLAMDARTVYSDGISIDANKSGLVLNFTQASDTKGSSNTIARVGMSYEQAERVMASLQQAALYGRHSGGPKQLPPSTKNRKRDIS